MYGLHIIVAGHLEIGLRAFGPFKTGEDADAFYAGNKERLDTIGMPAWKLKLHAPGILTEALEEVINEKREMGSWSVG